LSALPLPLNYIIKVFDVLDVLTSLFNNIIIIIILFGVAWHAHGGYAMWKQILEYRAKLMEVRNAETQHGYDFWIFSRSTMRERNVGRNVIRVRNVGNSTKGSKRVRWRSAFDPWGIESKRVRSWSALDRNDGHRRNHEVETL